MQIMKWYIELNKMHNFNIEVVFDVCAFPLSRQKLWAMRTIRDSIQTIEIRF